LDTRTRTHPRGHSQTKPIRPLPNPNALRDTLTRKYKHTFSPVHSHLKLSAVKGTTSPNSSNTTRSARPGPTGVSNRRSMKVYVRPGTTVVRGAGTKPEEAPAPAPTPTAWITTGATAGAAAAVDRDAGAPLAPVADGTVAGGAVAELVSAAASGVLPTLAATRGVVKAAVSRGLAAPKPNANVEPEEDGVGAAPPTDGESMVEMVGGARLGPVDTDGAVTIADDAGTDMVTGAAAVLEGTVVAGMEDAGTGAALGAAVVGADSPTRSGSAMGRGT
jgi:hypothetical protein